MTAQNNSATPLDANAGSPQADVVPNAVENGVKDGDVPPFEENGVTPADAEDKPLEESVSDGPLVDDPEGDEDDEDWGSDEDAEDPEEAPAENKSDKSRFIPKGPSDKRTSSGTPRKPPPPPPKVKKQG